MVGQADIVERLDTFGVYPRPMSVAQFGELVRTEVPRYRDVVVRSGAKVE